MQLLQKQITVLGVVRPMDYENAKGIGESIFFNNLSGCPLHRFAGFCSTMHDPTTQNPHTNKVQKFSKLKLMLFIENYWLS